MIAPGISASPELVQIPGQARCSATLFAAERAAAAGVEPQLEPSKTKMVEFGRFAARDSKRHGRKLETVTFLGFTHFCTRNRAGNFMVGRKTDKTRYARCLAKLTRVMAIVRHRRLAEQAVEINRILQGHYAYFGMGGNLRFSPATTTAVRPVQPDEIPGRSVNPWLKRPVREICRQASVRRDPSSRGGPYSTPGRVTPRATLQGWHRRLHPLPVRSSRVRFRCLPECTL